MLLHSNGHRSYIVVLIFVVARACLPVDGERVSTRGTLFDGPYGLAAARNLSLWRSSLFPKLERFLQAHPQYLHLNTTRHDGQHGFFAPFEPYVTCPPGRPLRRVGGTGGTSDGGKWLCGIKAMQPPCTVVSLGSNGDYSFEEAVLKETKCTLVTLDCTVKKPQSLSTRHKFFQKCISGQEALSDRNDFMTYAQITSELKLPATAAPLLKIDVEGYEYAVLSDWTEATPNLPEQIAVEVHFRSWSRPWLSKTHPMWGRRRFGVLDLGLFFSHLANLGYGIVSKEDNPLCGYCSEFTLLRVERPQVPS